jgi:hypothetical protein
MMANKREVRRLVEKWRDRLWLGQWLIIAGYEPEIETSSAALDTIAIVEFDSAYRKAAITVATNVWDKQTPKKKNRAICHEMLHVALSPLRDFVKQLEREISPSKKAVYEKWFESVDETITEHFCNVMLAAAGELKD